MPPICLPPHLARFSLFRSPQGVLSAIQGEGGHNLSVLNPIFRGRFCRPGKRVPGHETWAKSRFPAGNPVVSHLTLTGG